MHGGTSLRLLQLRQNPYFPTCYSGNGGGSGIPLVERARLGWAHYLIDMRYLEALGHAILTLHGAEGTHVRSVPHTEVFRGETVWTRTVEVFALTDHPQTAICYAWGYPKPDDPARFDIVTVLGIPPPLTLRKAP